MWEDLALDIDLSAQETIIKQFESGKVPHIAVFILWSRLGSELSEDRTPRPGGGAYHSGTEHEFDLMMRLRRESGGTSPVILAYKREDERGFEREDWVFQLADTHVSTQPAEKAEKDQNPSVERLFD